MKYKVLTLKEKREWSELLNRLPIEQQDVYYTPEYYSLYQYNGDGDAQCFVFEQDGNIAMYPYLLNCVNNMDYVLNDTYYDVQSAYGYGGIIANSKNRNFIRSFWDVFNDYCRKNNIIAEFLRLHPIISNPIYYTYYHQIFFNRKTVMLDLTLSEDILFYNFQHSTKKQIRRAGNRYGLSLKVYDCAPANLSDYFKIYTSTMQRTEAIDYLYFSEEYFKNFMNLNNALLFVANHDEDPVSVIFGMYYGLYFHGHLGGNLHQSMKMSPSSYLYWEMIKHAKSLGCKFLHLGGGNSNSEDDPLLKFKTNFSKSTLDFYIAKRIHNQRIYEEVVKQWEHRNPEKIISSQNVLLKYHY